MSKQTRERLGPELEAIQDKLVDLADSPGLPVRITLALLRLLDAVHDLRETL